MEFDKTRWSCPLNSDQNCTQKSARGGGGKRVEGLVGSGDLGGGGGLGVVGVRGV